ncbi:hypothetical protein Y1Q_0009390 [Alligator mississippiensis]|uniref:Uncharacterized protein n=1 Tax=Alligator mississippiensis TaxID=8496 RepID=A0A151N7S5_ALLMI|nr:hypothetical protein Y1Q_0009390 [Alligator mississippiensis]
MGAIKGVTAALQCCTASQILIIEIIQPAVKPVNNPAHNENGEENHRRKAIRKTEDWLEFIARQTCIGMTQGLCEQLEESFVRLSYTRDLLFPHQDRTTELLRLR